MISPPPSEQSLVVLRFDHLRHFFSAAANSGFTVLPPSQRRTSTMDHSRLQAQLSAQRRRIRDNVKAAISQDWASLQAWYKPHKIQDASDTDWIALVTLQDSVKEKIEIAKKPSTDPVKKYHIIKGLRDEFPELAAKVAAPLEPEQAPELPKVSEKPTPTSPTLPSYEEATTGRRYLFSLDEPIPQPCDTSPAFTSKRPFALRMEPRKRTKRVDFDLDGATSDEDDNGQSDDFSPKQERGRRVSTHGDRQQGNEDFDSKLKGAVTEEQLLRQNEDLKAKFRLDQIQIFKKIAEIHNDNEKKFELFEEELEIKHRRDIDKAKRQLLGE